MEIKSIEKPDRSLEPIVVPFQKRKSSLQHDSVVNKFTVEKSTASALGEHSVKVVTALHPGQDSNHSQSVEPTGLIVERKLSLKIPLPKTAEILRH